VLGPSGGRDLGMALGVTAVKVVALVVLVAFVGTRVIPWLLDRVAATRSRELFTLAVLVIALGIAVGSAAAFSVSMALGAFLAGLVVGRSEFAVRAASDALPLRDAFAVLFFVSVGMLLDPVAILQSPGMLLGALAIVLVGKPLAAWLVLALMRYPARIALPVGAALAQIGEFSFILATLGRQLEVLSAEGVNLVVGTAIVSIVLNPLVYGGMRPLERWVVARSARRHPPVSAAAVASDADAAPRTPAHRAVIVGYGPIGRVVARLLRDNDVDPTIVELNVETVRQLRDEQVHAVYGDAGQRDTLAAAGVARADTLVLSVASLAGSAACIEHARDLNPHVTVLARASSLRELAELHDAGADRVYSGEGEVALALTEAVLQRLRATPEQIERERARVREDLARGEPPRA
jgi:CPA2 family monovalent cation:H+ antiporter-2